MARNRVGWYRLAASGHVFHGTIPTGAVELVEPPTSGDHPVQPAEDEAAVAVEVAGVDLPADPLEVVETPGGGDTGSEDESGGDVDGQDGKPTRPRARKGTQGSA